MMIRKDVALPVRLAAPHPAMEYRAVRDDPDDPDEYRLSMLMSYFLEYGLAPVFYHMGMIKSFHAALAAQLVFMVASSAYQYYVIDRCGKWDSPLLRGKVESVMGVPVGCLRFPRWLYELFVQLPNYTHVHQTAVVAGSSRWAWKPKMQMEFLRRWSVVPVVGHFLGEMGLPGQLTCLLVMSLLVHGVAAFVGFTTGSNDELASAGNLLLLGRALNDKTEHLRGVSIARAAVGLFSKLPMVWVKTSLLAMTFDTLDDPANRVQLWENILAVLLAWYAMLPAMQFVAALFKYVIGGAGGLCDPDIGFLCPLLTLFALGIAVLAAHFIGIFVCPSHDLSVLHGCTPPAGSELLV